MPSEIIQGRVEDFRFTPIFETEEVELTYLPTGFSTRMTLPQVHQFVLDTAAVIEQLRGADLPTVRRLRDQVAQQQRKFNGT